MSNEVRKQRSKVDHHLYNVDLPKHLDEKVMIKRMMSGGGVRTFEFIPTLVELDMFNCEAIFKDGTVMQKLQKQDIIIGTSASFCGSLIAEYLKLPHILIHPAVFTALASLFMVPLPPSYVPVMQTASTDQMTFMERLKNVFFVAGQEILFRFVFLPMFKPFQQKHNILPDKDVGELLGSAEMHLVQLDFAIEYAHPLMPSKLEQMSFKSSVQFTLLIQ